MSVGADDDYVIFVAMPGTIRGANAQWKDVAQIKKHLYERVAREVSEAVDVTYRVRVEVDEYRPGNIHQSMFGAALRAPVYIADLTGLNANVYLELGVRWAVRDNVTVLTCQSLDDDLAFNVSPSPFDPAMINPTVAISGRFARREVGSYSAGLGRWW